MTTWSERRQAERQAEWDSRMIGPADREAQRQQDARIARLREKHDRQQLVGDIVGWMLTVAAVVPVVMYVSPAIWGTFVLGYALCKLLNS